MIHKYDIAAALSRRYGLGSYLEIVTSTTGNEFGCVDASQFTLLERAMYYCPSDWNDGFPVHYRTELGSSSALDIPRKFDLVFIDAWHEYKNTIEDIQLALRLTTGDGIVLIHDCSPWNEEHALPKLPAECKSGRCDRPWSGVTYAAFLDTVLSSPELSYATVDEDHGCGVISKSKRFSRARPTNGLVEQWTSTACGDFSTRYSFFDSHRGELLQLIKEIP